MHNKKNEQLNLFCDKTITTSILKAVFMGLLPR